MTQVTLTEDTFIDGVLKPAGTVVNVDFGALGVSGVNDEKVPNLAKVGKAQDPIEYEVASIAPTGPNPQNPQAVPPGTQQISDSYVAPAGEDGTGVKVVAETPDTAKKK